MTTANPSQSFMKQLAANDRRTRDKAVDSLRSYLRHHKSLSSLELLQLWKGLFYCMWMSDKPRNQQQLARDLAGLVDILPKENVVPFLEAFWKTMAREWGGIDVLRMDKFLYLVRQYLSTSFAYFAKGGWKDTERLGEYMDVLKDTPLNARDQRIPNGMRYHVIDIYVDEMEKVEAEGQEGEMPVEVLLAPLRALARDGLMRSVRERAKEALKDKRIWPWVLEEVDEIGVNDVGMEASKDSAGKDILLEEEEWGGIED